MGERLYGEGFVQLDSEIAVDSWCYDSNDSQIYCVDGATNNTLTLR